MDAITESIVVCSSDSTLAGAVLQSSDIADIIMSHLSAPFVASTLGTTCRAWIRHAQRARRLLLESACNILNWYRRVKVDESYVKSELLRDLRLMYPANAFLQYPEFAVNKRAYIREATIYEYMKISSIEKRTRSDVVQFILNPHFTSSMMLEVGF